MSDYLSEDQAIAQLAAVQAAPEPEAPAVPAAAPEAAAEPAEPVAPESAETPSEGVTTPEDAAAPAEPASESAPAEPAEPAKPAVEPPHFWSADKKARFAELPSDVQDLLHEQAKNGEVAVNRSLEAAATAKKAAEEATTKAAAEVTRITDLASRLGEMVTDKDAAFQARWGKATSADWVALAKSDPDQYTQLKAQFDAEHSDLQRHKDAKADAERVVNERVETERAAYIAREADHLRQYAPELADPRTAPTLAPKLTSYLKTSLGVTDEEMPHVSGRQLAAALKAMKYDELMAKPVTAQPKPAAAAPAPAVRPAGSGAKPPQTAAATAVNRLAQSGRPEDAVAALLAMSQG